MTVKVSPPLALEFVEALSEHAWQALFDWMSYNNAPQESLSLLRNINSFHTYEKLVESGNPPEELDKLCDIGEEVTETVNAIVALGGKFSGPGSMPNPPTPPAWSGYPTSKKKGKGK